MANQEQLEILKQGVEVWNKWRNENPGVEIDLSQVSISGIKLIVIFNNGSPEGVNLSKANLNNSELNNAKLIGANLDNANLNKANLNDAILNNSSLVGCNLGQTKLNRVSFWKANLSKSNLGRADLSYSNLSEANLRNANFSHANLTGAHLNEAYLGGANLKNTELDKADFRGAHLKKSNFSNAFMSETTLGKSDLSKTLGLATVKHFGPSSILTDTFVLSKGIVPEAFLKGCGLSDWEIESTKLCNPELNNEEINKILYKIYDLRATQALQISPLFISYSHADSTFVDRVENQLNKKGIRFWRDVHDAKAGRLETQIDRAIRQNPTVLLILSEHSLKSDWVEHEVRTARGLEKEMGRDVLCPIALDNSWKNSPWSKRIMEQVMEYNILDFSAWKDDSKFGNIFDKLIDGLGLFYK